MKKLLVTVSLCLCLMAPPAPALEPLPAPKLPDDAPAAARKEAAGESKSRKSGKSRAADSKEDAEAKDGRDDGGKDKDKDKDKGKGGSEGGEKQSDDEEKAEPKTPGDVSFQGDSRIKTLLYDETDVYTITTRYGYQTNIVFSPVEEIQLISVGDRSLWQIIPNGNRMFIRPMEEDVITNMTVITNKHSYQFDLKSLPADKGGNIYVARFVYDSVKNPANLLPPGFVPPEFNAANGAMPASSPFGVGPSIPVPQAASPAPQAAASPALQPQPASSYPQVASSAPPPAAIPAAQPAAPSSATPAGAPNYSYTYAGPDELAPLQVYDDGRATYLKYRDVRKLPPNVYVVDAAGRESPVGYSVKGDYMVLDVVAGELALKGADNVGAVHVFNEVLNPG